MLDHLLLAVADVPAAVAFYGHALAPLGIGHVHDDDGAGGPPGHSDLKGFGSNGRVYFWLRGGSAGARAVHIGFVAGSSAAVDAFYAAAMAAGAADGTAGASGISGTSGAAGTSGAPGARLHYDPRYYAANIVDLDGYSIEAVYQSWQHAQP